MDKMVAYCGLVCTDCPIYKATRKDDDARRVRVAGEWSKMFGWDLSASDINCDGCLAEEGRLFKYCHDCGVRPCAGERGVATCAQCGDYICDKVQALIDVVPMIKTQLEALRAEL